MSDSAENIWRVELRPAATSAATCSDARGRHLVELCHAAGMASVDAIEVRDLFFLGGALNEPMVADLVGRMLVDPIVEHATWAPLEWPLGRRSSGHSDVV